MKKYYDLHIHSCLSPCGDDDMTPSNIAGMAYLKGLDIVALTDHNTTKNCPAFFHECSKYGLTAVAGMELTTSEDVHMVCLFPQLDFASAFGEEVDKKRIMIKNRADIFGNQIIYAKDDIISGEEKYLLINATTLSINDAKKLCEKYGGICYPAHIDRSANGIISVLGVFPDYPRFSAYELNRAESKDDLCASYDVLNHMKNIVSSDAHSLGYISESENFIETDDSLQSAEDITSALFDFLK